VIIEFEIFSGLISGALLLTCLSPLILLALLIKDWKKGDLW